MAKATAKGAVEPRLPGTEDPEIPEIAEAGGKLIAAEAKLQGAKAKVKTAKEELLAALKKHKMDHYLVGGIEAWIDTGSETAKAKPIED
jgi:hypothetical protein